MTIRKSENESLFKQYEVHRMFKRGKISIQDMLKQYMQGAKIADIGHMEGFYQDF